MGRNVQFLSKKKIRTKIATHNLSAIALIGNSYLKIICLTLTFLKV